MIKQVLFSLVIVFGLISCEDPVHEEYEMDGEIHDWSDNGNNGDNEDDEDDADVYLPLAVGNWWTMEVNSQGATQTSKITGIDQFDGESYYRLEISDSNGATSESSYHIRKDGDNYIARVLINSAGMVSDPYFVLGLKDNVSMEDSWNEVVEIVYHIDGIDDIIFNTDTTYTVVEMYDSYESNGVTYENVMVLQSHEFTTSSTPPYENYSAESIKNTFYALNIGQIEAYTGTSIAYLVDYHLE